MDGFIIVNKPKDFTSHDVVNVIRRSFRGQKVGHTGTLDPGATGVLPVCIGKATKLQDYMMSMPKTYRCDILFGLESDTLDREGKIISRDPGFFLDPEALLRALATFCGEIEQVPPMVSAIKVNGVPLYKMARKGMEVERKSRRITIYGLDVLATEEAAPYPQITVEVTCSKGTYIRALARDIAAALGTTAIIDNLVRLSTGAFRYEDSLTLEEIAKKAGAGDFSFLLPLKAAVPQLPVLRIRDIGEIKAVLSGNYLPKYRDLQEESVYFLEDMAGTPLALAHFVPGLGLKPDKILSARKDETVRKDGFQVISHGKTGEFSGTVIALGNFDGVHLGHQTLIRAMRNGAQRGNFTSLVLSFDPHPKAFFHSQGEYSTLQQKEDKVAQVARLGIDVLCFYPFDEALSRRSPQSFVDDILIGEFAAKEIYVGYDFKFGYHGQGNGAWLEAYGKERGIRVHIIEEIDYEGVPVSSSRIKEALNQGDIPLANLLLGYNFTVSGVVVEGQKIGRTLGFPTANLAIPSEQVLPAPGVYAFFVNVDGERYQGVGNIGVRPTLGDHLAFTVEAHLLDADLDLYGRNVSLIFVQRLRGEEKFPDLAALKTQIEADKDQAVEILHHFR